MSFKCKVHQINPSIAYSNPFETIMPHDVHQVSLMTGPPPAKRFFMGFFVFFMFYSSFLTKYIRIHNISDTPNRVTEHPSD